MGDATLHYRLPLSVVRVSGTVKHSLDTILQKTASEPTVTAEITVIADPTKSTTLTYSQGLIRDTNLTVELTEDGRLTSTTSEVTGQASKVVTALVGVAATGIGFALGGFPGAAMAAAGAARQVQEQLIQDQKFSDDDLKVASAYRDKYGSLADTRQKLDDSVKSLSAEFERVSEEASRTSDPKERLAKVEDLAVVDKALGIARAELGRLDFHFSTWRATTVISSIESIERIVTFDEIAAAGRANVAEGKIDFGDAPEKPPVPMQSSREKVTALWSDLGLLIQTANEQPLAKEGFPAKLSGGYIVIREPRPVIVKVSARGADSAPVVVSERRHLILDSLSPHSIFELRTSAWGRKTSTVKFSAAGTPIGFSSGSTSSVAALAEATGELPGKVAVGLDQAGSLMDKTNALRAKALDYEIAEVKKKVDLHEQRILEAGISATEESQAELLRLKQRQEILEAKKAIGDLTPVPNET